MFKSIFNYFRKARVRDIQTAQTEIITDISDSLEKLRNVADDLHAQKDANTILIGQLQAENADIIKTIRKNEEITEQIGAILYNKAV